MNPPRILVAGLRGSSGKTLITLGIIAAWAKRGHRVAAYKKGPDYIDAAWLSVAAGTACRNLDLFLMSQETIVRSFVASAATADLAVIEGNRGLFDGMDAQGTCSTAELAKMLQAPVVLAVDCTKSIRTVAATILGCQRLDPDLPLRAVILNQVAGPRHESGCANPSLKSAACLSWEPFRASLTNSFRNGTWGWCRRRSTIKCHGRSHRPPIWPCNT